MTVEYIVPVVIGFVLIGLGISGSFRELGLTSDKQYGTKSLERMLTSLVMSVCGTTIVLFVIVLKQVLN